MSDISSAINPDGTLNSDISEEDLLSFIQNKYEPGANPLPGQDIPVSSQTTDNGSEDDEPDSDPDLDEDDQEGDEDESTSDQEDESPHDSEVAPPTGYQITLPDGSQVILPPDVIQSYFDFDQRLRADPNLLQHIQTYVPPQAGVGATSTPSTPADPSLNIPDDIDVDDPNIKFLIEQNQALQARINTITENQVRHEQILSQEQINQANSLIASGRAAFAAKHPELDASEVEKIIAAGTRSGYIPTYMQGIDPVNGTPVTPDPVAAMDIAFESAYWANPSYREKALAATAAEQRADRSKKRKASALAGSSGNAPRSAPDLSDPKERHKAMVAHVAEAMDA